MTNKEKWVAQTRQKLIETGIDESRLNDEDVLRYLKAGISAQICEAMGFRYKWQYDLYWDLFIEVVEPPESAINSIDVESFMDNLNEN